MSEQTIQNALYSNPVSILDKYTCYSLGATTIKNLVKQNILADVLQTVNFGKKPDVLIVDKDKHVVVFLEFKLPKDLNNQKKLTKRSSKNFMLLKILMQKYMLYLTELHFIGIIQIQEIELKMKMAMM